MDDEIHTHGLAKSFGRTRALDGVDLTVRTGEVHGFLGPNGAGKSTLMRVLLGLLRHDDGEVAVLGGDPWADAVALHRRLAYVPGDVHLWPNLSGGEAIDLFGSLRGGLDERRRRELIDRFDLDPTKRCGTYSKGNRQKVALIAGFASDVELYLLDEPTSGLDPLMIQTFQQVVRELRDAGRTVLLSSHVLAEVEATGDRVSIIREGRVVESGTLAELRHLTRSMVTATTHEDPSLLAELPTVHALERDGREVRFEVEQHHLDEIVGHLHRLGISSLTCTPPTLEQLFLRHYDRSAGGPTSRSTATLSPAAPGTDGSGA